ncbi:glycogen debranching enzyme N-terminal domain-containing protein [Candidatus Bathyarchaeota archaeon]|nr:glycogen debranching enzyme N-terminal domain-containing protein [Candidatus Bathyarchaeota archaeon]
MTLPQVRLNREKLAQFEDAIKTEWLITNGLGGYASSTVLGVNTRKYHGLLVAALHPPGNRRICVARLDEEISVGNNTYPLGSHEFQNGIFPKGHLFLEEFSISPFPKWVYDVQGVEVRKTVFMPYEKNAVVTVYNILNKDDSDAKIRVFPLVNWRHFHEVTDRWKISWEFMQKQDEKEVDVQFSVPQSVLAIKTTNGKYYAAGKWLEKIYYREEAMRGESCLEDCYQTGYFETSVKANKTENFAVTAVADKNEADVQKILTEIPNAMYNMEALLEQEILRRENLLERFYEQHKSVSVSDWLNWLALAADLFIVRGLDETQKAVIGGYHWFDVWGRDAFVSLPGLMLVTGRFDDARKVFLTFKKYAKDGLIPNFLPDQPKEPAAYNAVDATLWFVNAVLQYLKYTSDFKFVQAQLWTTLKAIVEAHVRGTAFNISMDSDGLLSHGSQLTWMDATVDGKPVTPRAGKAVEVQALWYNALKIMELLAKRFAESAEAERYAQLAAKAKESFAGKFWNAEKNCLFDVGSETGTDDSLRPNQVIAAALDFTMLDNVKNERIVDVVFRELLTPYGLRTLAKNDSKYVGVYAGDRRSRDKAYHNGTVWPWSLGPFVTAFLKAKGYAEYRREYALKHFLMPLFSGQLYTAGLGVIGEVFDGEPPHIPRGCIAQAWSIAEPFRAYVEDVMQNRTKYEKEVLQGLR